ncbi:MAG: NUDIX hydrolase [Saprospirales bacterium]|nr:NUDIX hydrolase [Saprospirales bacterium]MBK8922349.1 NUDIX hydrolase [Saprospirales bacterium]
MNHVTDPLPWKVENRAYVYDRRPYMILREDAVRLPNGAQIPDYFVFEYPDWVSVLAVNTEDQFVLIRQYRHGLGLVHYELAAGVADPGEPLLVSARRELLEETGYGGGDWQLWLRSCANPGTHNNWCHIFLATGVERLEAQRLERTEDISVHLLYRAEVLEMLRSGGVAQALHTAALWRYFAEHR